MKAAKLIKYKWIQIEWHNHIHHTSKRVVECQHSFWRIAYF